jgi:hypothetical protein
VTPHSRVFAREIGAAFLLHLLLAIAMTWPLACSINVAVADPGDPLINAWVLDWFHHAVRSEARLFDANIFHPERATLALSEHLAGPALMTLPLASVGIDPLTIHNVLLLLSFPMLGVATHLLGRTMQFGVRASFIASLLAAFNPWRFTHLTHLQDLWSASIPLLIATLVHWSRRRSAGRALLVGGAFLFNASGNLHWLAFGSVAAALVFLLLLVIERPSRREAMILAAAIVCCMLAITPLLLPYASKLDDRSTSDRAAETLSYSAEAADWLVAGFTTQAWRGFRNDGSTNPERWLFPGGTLLLAALLSLFLASWTWGKHRKTDEGDRKEPRPRREVSASTTRRAFAIAIPLLLLGFIGSLGLNAPLHEFLSDQIPGFRSIRVPARWSVIGHTGLAILAAYSLHHLLRARMSERAKSLAAASIAVLAIAELRASPIRFFTVPEPVMTVHRWLASVPERFAIVEFPIRQELEYRYMLGATAHHRPSMNGVSGSEPDIHRRLREAHRDDPGLAAEIARSSGAKLLVLHTDFLGDERERVREWLARDLRSGRLTFLRSFPSNIDRDLVFTFGDPFPVVSMRDERDQADLAAFLADRRMQPRSPIGFLEAPAIHSKADESIHVAGWAASDAPISRVDVSLGSSRSRHQADLLARPDIRAAFPDTAAGAISGFSIDLGRPRILLDRLSIIRVVITDEQGTTKVLDPVYFEWTARN